MILMKSVLPKPYTTPTRHTEATIKASGEPGYRTWHIEAKWYVRNGQLEGQVVLQNKWLTGALTQLIAFEQQCMIKKHGSKAAKVTFRLHCPPDLHSIVTRTAKRYEVPYEEKI